MIEFFYLPPQTKILDIGSTNVLLRNRGFRL